MSSQPERDVADRLFRAWERWDLDTIQVLLSDEAVDARPQSGEHFVGRRNILGMYREVPGPPRIVWHRIRGSGWLWVAEGVVDYGEGPVNLVGVVEIADALVRRADFYFASRFDPPVERRKWAADPSSAQIGDFRR